MEDKIIGREGGQLSGYSAYWASHQEGLWNNFGGTEEQDIQKKKGIACRLHGLWMVVTRRGLGASGQMAQWLELQSWGVGRGDGSQSNDVAFICPGPELGPLFLTHGPISCPWPGSSREIA